MLRGGHRVIFRSFGKQKRCFSELVTLDKRGRVGILRLNDPHRLNPMTSAMGEALQRLLIKIFILFRHALNHCFLYRKGEGNSLKNG
jgi:hypothetical protein